MFHTQTLNPLELPYIALNNVKNHPLHFVSYCFKVLITSISPYTKVFAMCGGDPSPSLPSLSIIQDIFTLRL